MLKCKRCHKAIEPGQKYLVLDEDEENCEEAVCEDCADEYITWNWDWEQLAEALDIPVAVYKEPKKRRKQNRSPS